MAPDPRTSVSEVIRDFRRDQVIEAARSLFSERATLDVSMGDIAERAGVSRSTLYNHFTTRDDVLSACLASGQIQLLDAVTTAVDGVDDPVSKLTALLETCIDHVDHNPVFYRLMAARATVEPAIGDASTIELSLTGIKIGELLRTIIDDGVSTGRFGVAVDEAVWLVGVVLTGILQTRRVDDTTSPAALALQAVSLLDRGFRTDANSRKGKR